MRQVADYGITQSALATNRDKDALLRDGVLVSYRAAGGQLKKERLRVFDFATPTHNHFLCVRELWVRGDLYRRRADIVGFVNGVPLLFMELKNVSKNLRDAFDRNLKDYRDTVPHLFHHNAIIVLSNGVDAKLGAVSGAFEHFHEWKRLEESEPGVVDMETLLKGVCAKAALMDVFENFIVFDDSSGKAVKIVAKNHQFLGVNRAVAAVRDREKRQENSVCSDTCCACILRCHRRSTARPLNFLEAREIHGAAASSPRLQWASFPNQFTPLANRTTRSE